MQIDSHAAAANNLAWIYVTRNAKLDVAVQLAEAANAALANQPEILDTLGGAYFKQGQFAAIRPLTAATQLDPRNAIHQFHLGMAHAKNGDDSRARRALQQALKLDPQFDGAALARTTLDTLVY